MSVGAQNQPVNRQIGEFKTSHLERGKIPRSSLTAAKPQNGGCDGESTQDGSGSNDFDVAWWWLVSAADCSAVGRGPRDGGSVCAVGGGKPRPSADRLGRLGGSRGRFPPGRTTLRAVLADRVNGRVRGDCGFKTSQTADRVGAVDWGWSRGSGESQRVARGRDGGSSAAWPRPP